MEDRRFRVGANNRFGGGLWETRMTRLITWGDKTNKNRLKPRFRTVTRTVEKTLIEWNYYKDGKLVNSSSIVPGQNYNAKINFSKVSGPVDDIKDTPDDDFTPTDPNIPNPKPRPKPELLILHENNDNVSDLYAASVNGNNVSQIGGDTFKSKDAFQITLQAKQPSRYTISKFKVLRGSITADSAESFQDYDVQELNIQLTNLQLLLFHLKK